MSKVKEAYEAYRKHFLTLDIEILKELLRQYEFEREWGLGLNTIKIVTLKQVIKGKEDNL